MTSISEWNLSNKITIAGRLGGDEFILLIRGCISQKEVSEFLKNILESLNSVRFDGLNGIQASLGVTQISSSDKNIDNAYKRADDALYKSKRLGKNQIQFAEE